MLLANYTPILMKKQLELAITRLQRVNSQLKKLLNMGSERMTEDQINEILDEMFANEKLIES